MGQQTAGLDAAKAEVLFFDPIKEPRDSYFVEYQPPGPHGPFALLNVVFPEATPNKEDVTQLLESELRQWIARYPIPIMASAFGATETVLPAGHEAYEHHLVGWIDPTSSEVICSWKLNDLTRHLDDHRPQVDLRNMFAGVGFKTQADVKANADRYVRERRSQRRVLIIVLTLWIAVLPATWATLEFLGPGWLSAAVFGFTLWKIYSAWRKMMGYSKPSASEAEEAEKKRKMEHYYHHCERNLSAFERLKGENFENEIAERTRKEASALNSNDIA